MNIKSKIVIFMSALLFLNACDKKDDSITPARKNTAELQKSLQQIKSELVFVKGGEFLMGDYGEEHGPERLPYDSNKDSKPLHKVELSSFSIGKFKVTNEVYKKYLEFINSTGRVVTPESGLQDFWNETNRISETPAHVDWFEADKYCHWLAEVTQLPFSLPTEAQWEYAARNRGEYVIAPTNDGTIQIKNGKGINITTADDREEYAMKVGNGLRTLSPMPGDARVPNPLGIYDMAGNGFEWMKDWYDPDYYKSSPVKDPQGPEKPVFKDYKGRFAKVTRSQDLSGPGRGLTVVRHFKDPNNNNRIPVDKTVRCVVNDPHPVQ